MAAKEVEPELLGCRPHEVQAEPAGACSAVEDDDRPVGGAQLGVRRLAAVDGRRVSGRGDGPSGPPEAHVHGKSYDYHTGAGFGNSGARGAPNRPAPECDTKRRVTKRGRPRRTS